MIDFKRLRQVLALAEHRNFARAAKALHLSQPALTRSIQALEDEMGARLFDRGRRGVEPTAMGRLVVTHARSLDTAMEDLHRDIELASGSEIGKLDIGVGLWTGAALVGEPIGRLAQRFPRLRINVVATRWYDLPDRVRAREFDVMVGDLTQIAGSDEFETAPMPPRRGYVVCRRGHPLTRIPVPTLNDVFSYPVAGPELPAHTVAAVRRFPREVRDLLQRGGGLLPVRCDSSSILKAIIARSDVVSVMEVFMVAEELRRGELVILPQPDFGLPYHHGAAWLRGRTMSPPASAFVEALLAYDRDFADQEVRLVASMNPAGGAGAPKRRAGTSPG